MSRPEDFRDDFDAPAKRRADKASSAGVFGFIFCLVSVALIFVVALLWYLLRQEGLREENPSRERWMALWFIFLDLLSLIIALFAVILGVRGLEPSNKLYRGYSMIALIVGVLEMIATALFGCVLACVALIVLGK
jgi:hypothetical protein